MYDAKNNVQYAAGKAVNPMATPPNRRTRLVADRRPTAASSRTRSTGGGGKGGGGGGGRRTQTWRKKPKKKGNFLTRFLGGLLRWIWRIVWGVMWRVTAAVSLVMAAATFYFYTTMPNDLNDMLDGRARGSVTMLDADGEVFAWRGESFGGYTTSESVSPNLRNAIVATEDRRFYWHFGVSPRGVAGAIRSNMAAGRGPFSGAGGSTITQQVSKLLCLGTAFDPEVWDSEADYESDCRQGTIWRKIQELPYAFALELRFTKAEILTIYINRAFLGAGSRGFEAASQRYFGHSASEVNPQEAALLAGLLVAPSYYAPTRNLERAQERANVVLGLMA